VVVAAGVVHELFDGLFDGDVLFFVVGEEGFGFFGEAADAIEGLVVGGGVV
jgi:hypothetical protein